MLVTRGLGGAGSLLGTSGLGLGRLLGNLWPLRRRRSRI